MFLPFFYTVATLTSTGSQLVASSVCTCHYAAVAVSTADQPHYCTYQVDLNYLKGISDQMNLEGTCISISSVL